MDTLQYRRTTSLDVSGTDTPRSAAAASIAGTEPQALTATTNPPVSPGLVTYAITSRESSLTGQGPIHRPTAFKFADLDECQRGARAIGKWEWDGREGPVPQIEVAPGLIRVTHSDLNRREKSANRAAERPLMLSDSELSGDGVGEPEGVRGAIAGWSVKSRARMVATLAEIDLAPMMMGMDKPGMVTLTYPGCDEEVKAADRVQGRFHKCDGRCAWQVVAPDGEAVKVHLQTFFKRFERAWGRRLMTVWKLEFQGRGAPHFHLLMAPPSGIARAEKWAIYQEKLAAWEISGRSGRKPYWRGKVGDGLEFKQWLSVVWADVVGHPDPVERAKHEKAGTGVDYAEGDRARDPKRAAVYFGKHGTFSAKDYQHDVPELWQDSEKSVGRFWGYPGLKKIKGAATVSTDEALFIGRTLRKYGSRTRVWNPDTQSHEFRPVLRTQYRRRRKVSAEGEIKVLLDVDGLAYLDERGQPIEDVTYRKQTVRGRRMTGPLGAGFLLVNDGPAMARVLARAVEANRGEGRTPVGMRGVVSGRVGLA